MPGLFDAIKENVLPIFGGTGPGAQQSLMDAGAAAILSDTQDPLEAIAAASMAGRQRQQVEANRAQLQQLVQGAGMDVPSMQNIFLELLGQGNIDAARTVSEVLKTMAAGQTRQQPNLNFTTAENFNPETGLVESYRVGSDPTTGSIVSRELIGSAPPPAPDTFIQELGADEARSFSFDRGGTFMMRRQPDGTVIPIQMLQGDEPGIMDVAASRLAEVRPEDWVGIGSLASVMERMRGEGLFERGARFIGGLLTGPDAEMANSSAGMALMAMQQDLSGKQMTEAERTFMDGFMMPRVTDTPESRVQKGQLITTYVNARGRGLSVGEAIGIVRTMHALPGEAPAGGSGGSGGSSGIDAEIDAYLRGNG